MLLRIVMSAFGGFMLFNSVLLAFVSNFTVGNILEFLFGAVLLAWGVFYEKINMIKKRVIIRILKILTVLGISVVIAFCTFLFAYGNTDTARYNENAVIVLGAAVNGNTITRPLQERLDKAVDYLNKNTSAIAVVTGGQGPQENVTEAYAMEQYLINKGIAPERIIKEEKATSTSENYRFSKEILDTRFGGSYRAVVITNGFHVYRAVKLAEIEGMDVAAIHAPMPWYSVVPMYLREILAVLKLWILKY